MFRFGISATSRGLSGALLGIRGLLGSFESSAERKKLTNFRITAAFRGLSWGLCGPILGPLWSHSRPRGQLGVLCRPRKTCHFAKIGGVP